MSLSAKLGTGVGPELTLRLTERFNARLGLGRITVAVAESVDGVDYQGEFEMGAAYALADWHPFANGFRLSAGLADSRTQAAVDGRLSEAVMIGQQRVTPEDIDSVGGRLDFSGVAPYFGIGWGNAVTKRRSIHWGLDLGVLVSGPPSIRLIDNTGFIDPENLAREQQALAEDPELRDVDWLPVLGLSIGYSF